MRIQYVILSLIFLSGAAGAWGPATDKFVCHEAVKFVWGVEAVGECIPMRDSISLSEFCEATYRVMGEDYQLKCKQAVSDEGRLHPSMVSTDVFADSENHFDFYHCPINKGNERDWICGDRWDRPAYELSKEWMVEAGSASDMCMRVNFFCMAASYFADSQSQLRSVKYVANDCIDNIEASIDRSISNGLTDWSASQLCVFDNGKRGNSLRSHRQRLGESSSTLNKIIANLTIQGLGIKDKSYRPGRGVVILANTIDWGLAGGLVGFLRENGVRVVHATAVEFTQLRYNEHIIILGGQNAPEGVGQYSASVLPSGREDELLVRDASMIFSANDIWQTTQEVIVLAGHSAEDTQKAWMDNQQQVLSVVRQ